MTPHTFTYTDSQANHWRKYPCWQYRYSVVPRRRTRLAAGAIVIRKRIVIVFSLGFFESGSHGDAFSGGSILGGIQLPYVSRMAPVCWSARHRAGLVAGWPAR